MSNIEILPTPVNHQRFIIEIVVTADDAFGEPWPPGGFCSIVRRARGFTLWRRVRRGRP